LILLSLVGIVLIVVEVFCSKALIRTAVVD
jgi:hypothetical protein